MAEKKLQLLVPTTGTPHCATAVRMGARLALKVGGSLTLLTVVQRKTFSDQGYAILQKAARMAEEEGASVETSLRVGQPAREIVKESRINEFDLIVMGSRPWHSRLRSLLGSTSKAVLSSSPCPVLVAKGDASVPESMLVCDSGAVSPRLVERMILCLPVLLRSATRITVLHVMSQMSAGPGVRGWELRADANELVEAHTPEGELLISDARLLQKLDLQPVVKIRHGLVVEEIMLEAQEGDYDLVVIGAHQHGGWQDLLLDDLQQQIIACLDRSVLVVR